MFYKEEDHILAAFMDENDGRGARSCYSRIGQHSTAKMGYLRKLPLATPKEYLPLMLELMRAPYNYDFVVLNVKSTEQLRFLVYQNDQVYEDGLLLDADVLRERPDYDRYYIVAVKPGKNKRLAYHIKPLNDAGT